MDAAAGDWRAFYEDPLRWRFSDDTCSNRIEGVPRAHPTENELCSARSVFMHRPTHDPKLDASGRYPFSEHLRGRKRLWEIRFQVRFKQPPSNPIFFGVELGRYVPVSVMTRQVQKALVSTCRGIVGECYHTIGDERGGTDAELPAFVMPLWAFDQFHVAEAGMEPDLTGSLEGVGMRRSVGVKRYIAALKAAVARATPDTVFTFCFWGVSQFLDCLRWQMVGGIFRGATLDFNKLCGSPPVFLSMYELEDSADARHLPSRKRRYLHVAVWSKLRPPPGGDAAVEAALPVPTADDVVQPIASDESVAAMADLLDLCDGGPQAVEALGVGTLADEPCVDLLGLDLLDNSADGGLAAQAAAPEPGYATAKSQSPESCDLLGLL